MTAAGPDRPGEVPAAGPAAGSGRALDPGDGVPPSALPDTHGADVPLSGGGRTLLVFVPFAFSRTCTDELRELQDGLPELAARGVRVLAASCDTVFALRAWAELEGYAFPLLSDFWPHGAVARGFGVLDEAQGFARRGSFLLDDAPGGGSVVRWSLVHPGGRARPFAAYRDAVAAL